MTLCCAFTVAAHGVLFPLAIPPCLSCHYAICIALQGRDPWAQASLVVLAHLKMSFHCAQPHVDMGGHYCRRPLQIGIASLSMVLMQPLHHDQRQCLDGVRAEKLQAD